MRIWDLHCHLSGVPGLTPEERLKALLVYADRMGIERLCVYMGMKWSQDPTPADLAQQNSEVLRAIAKYPDRAFGFVYVSAKHPEESLAEIERCVANGPMVGVKLWVAEKCSVAAIDAIIRRAAELKAVIFQHTWFKTNGVLPENPKLHQTSLAYASDFNLLITALFPHGMSFFTTPMQIASLDHAMWFHRPVKTDDWLLYVVQSSNANNGRAFCTGKIYSKEGVLIASTAQEGLIRKL